MEFKKIKILFYFLFVLDIIAGIAAGMILGLLQGIIAGTVLLILNVTVYAIILKMQKIKEQSDGSSKKSRSL